jgi:hypothetical protein
VRAIASLVFRGSAARAAISIFGLAGSMDDSRMPDMILHLKNTAQLISAKLTLMAKGAGEPEGTPPLARSTRVDEYSSGRSR